MKTHILCLVLVLATLLMAFTRLKDFVASGWVTNENGVPLQAASVMIKGTRTGTATDQNGMFTLSIPGHKATLVISSPGYELMEVSVRNGENVQVKLKPSSRNYEEVIVMGYANKRQKSVRMNGTQSAASPAGAPLSGNDVYGYERKSRTGGSMISEAGRNREGYDHIEENRFLTVNDHPLSTFSIDVDAASYSNIRRMLVYDQLPPAGAVRIEEMINYFPYRYPQPTGEDPFSINTEIATCPWNSAHRLVSIGLQGRKLSTENLPPSNLTFLIDVSGSMEEEDKLPLVKASLKLLTDQLRSQDRVSIVVYAGNAGLVLPPTPGTEKTAIKTALDKLEAGGSTAGGQGIVLAYQTAAQHFMQPGNNRVILCTDGDFNVGLSSDDALERLIGEKRKSGIFLTVLGFGRGNYQDAKMQKLADKGNGHHHYIDNLNEARKVLVNEFGGTLFTIAKDVKLQIEFNPAKVQGYRLIGYENRLLAKEDFNNDKKDAGELGSGHTVTALYELVPAGIKDRSFDQADALKYQHPPARKAGPFGGELMNIKLRYKQPASDVSRLLEQPVPDQVASALSDNLRFAAAVAQFGMLLRNSPFRGSSTYALTEQMAASTLQYDPEGYRKEFAALVKKAHRLCNGADQAIR